MKKLFTLLTLALFAVSGAWAGEETATWTFETDASGLTLTPSGSATITRAQYSTTGSSWGSSSGSYCLYGNLGSTKGSSATITTNSSYNKISKISLLLGTTDRGKTEFALQVSPNSDFSSDVTDIQAQVTIKDNITSVTSNTAMYTVSYNIGTPVSGYVRIVIAQVSGSNNKKMLVDDLKITYDAGAVDPVFSLTKTIIGTDETSQIQVGSKGNLDGLTMKSLTYDDSKISINADGLITPLVAGGPYSITFTTDAVADKYNAGSADLSILVTAPVVATPEITPADGSRFFGASQEITITSATDGASIYYTTDGSTPTASSTLYNPADKPVITATTTIKAIAAKAGCTDSEVATATITKFVKSDLTSISTNATWNFNKLTANTSHAYYSSGIKLTDSTFPKKTDKDYFVYEDFKGDFFTIADGFDGTTIAFSQTEYPIRDNNFMQGTNLKFNTTVPGIVTVTYSNTGNRDNEDDRRFLTINGTKYGVGTMKSNANVTTSVPVAAGDVVIGGVLKKDESVQYLRIYSVSFSTTTSASVSEYEWVTYVSEAPLDFSGVANLSAYIVTGHSGNAITTTKMTGTVPANTPLLLSGAEGDYNIPVAGSSSTDVSANKLKAGTGAAVSAEGGKTKYVLSVADSKAVFKKINGTAATVPVGKAYLQFDEEIAAPLFDLDGEATGIKAVENSNIENQKFYNLAGQQVAQPTKGLYIVNGKKVIVK